MIGKLIANEPALVMGALRALVVLGVAFGLRLTVEQTAAIYGAVEALTVLVTRAVVTPNAKVIVNATRAS